MCKRISLLFFFVLGIVYAQQTNVVDFINISADIHFDPPKGLVNLTAKYKFKALQDADSIYIDISQPYHYEVNSKNFKGINYIYENRLIFKNDAGFKANELYEFELTWLNYPNKALYFINWTRGKDEGQNQQIWTQGQGKNTSNWLPSIDDVNDKIEFDLSITFDSKFEVISNGTLKHKEILNDSTIRWDYDMNKPMSSYLVALAIGHYNKKTEFSKNGIPLELYYYPQDSLKFEPTYRYSKQMFDFLEEEIGIPYPWEIYKQVPVKDFLYSGMENTTLTIFSDALMADSIGFKDRNYVNVNAHELAHQWFGNLVTAKSGSHHWLQEGFATYYALLAEQNVFGDDYYYWKLYEYAQQLLDQEKAGNSTSLLDPKSSSLTFYQKGCWALHILKEQIGEKAFKQAVTGYLLKHQFENVETSDFIREAEQASSLDLSEFVNTWLEVIELPQDQMVKSLNKSEYIQEYLDVDCSSYPAKCKDYLVSDISDKAKIKILSEKNYIIKKEDFNNSWEVRQAIAQNLREIPLDLKKSYESLLFDKSYVTIEAALYNLWVNFPEERSKYLQQTKDILGFSDYNVRLLWLALNLNTFEYQPDSKALIYSELRLYTNPNFGFELRMNAFNYLKLINGFDEKSLENLSQATQHHNWRFQKFAKQMLEDLKKDK